MAKARDPFWAFSHRTWKVPWPSLSIHWQSQSPSSFPQTAMAWCVGDSQSMPGQVSLLSFQTHSATGTSPFVLSLARSAVISGTPNLRPPPGLPAPRGDATTQQRAARGARPWSAPPVPPPPLARLLTLPSNHPVTSQQCLQHRHLPGPILPSLCCYQKHNFALLPASRLPVPPPPPPGPTAVRLNSAGLSPSPPLQGPAWPSKAPAFLLGLISHLPQPGTC